MNRIVQLHTFGQNAYGELALGDTVDRSVPTLVQFQDFQERRVNVVQVAAGNEHTLVLTQDGGVYSAGYNNETGYQISMEAHRGPNNNEVGRFKLIEKLKRKGVSKIFAANGCEHVVATTRNGKCYTYGFNAKGQLGHGITNTSTNVPKLVEALSKKVVTTIGCSYYHTIFACDDKTIYACGRNDFGQLGIGNDKDTAQPLPIKTLRGKEIVSVGCGQFHSIVVTSKLQVKGIENGEAYTFGKNDFGQLGLEEGNFSSPQQLMLEAAKPLLLKMISCGYYHSAGITTEGELYTWGRNQSGQLGLGVTEKMVFLPRKVSTLETQYEKVACGCYHTLAVSENKLYAFGRNRHGQLGDGTTIDRHNPVEVEFKGGEILQVAAGFYHSVVLSAKQETNSLSIEMLSLFESGKYSDIKFKVQGREIPAHKSIVSARSETFSNLLFGGMKQSGQRQIEIKDASYEAFRAILEYLYTDSVDRLSLLQMCSLGQGASVSNDDLDFVVELLSLADLYLIDSLKAYCARIIEPNINIDNVCNILLIADARYVDRLKWKCIQFICQNFKMMIAQKRFAELPQPLLHQVLIEASKKLCLEPADHSA